MARDKPEPGKTYRLTAASGTPCILAGNTLAESVVPVCTNCGQWQHHIRDGFEDCLNECKARGFTGTA